MRSRPVCTSLGWQIITSIPCFTLSATHASHRSGATASAFITATRNPCRVSRHLVPSAACTASSTNSIVTAVRTVRLNSSLIL